METNVVDEYDSSAQQLLDRNKDAESAAGDRDD